ncbi:2OG-Fe dioxygenase family protein [Acetobacter orientalis]|uniref:2OG-Fe dioxygenase family protein n=3 Tax=Acetobacter orientalis TaxID=146474 RepID=UPI0039E82973
MAETPACRGTAPTLPFEDDLAKNGFAYQQAATMSPLLEAYGLERWHDFAESWNHLGVDRYMADGGRYRRRRYATFSVTEEGITRKPHQPHYQSRDYNTLNGGIERWFKPMLPDIGSHPALLAILRVAHRMATDLTPQAQRPQAWHTEVHQFRIEPSPDTLGQPTPEGLHRDGVDWVCVVMIDRDNIASGETSIHDLNRTTVGSFTLTNPLDTAFVNDSRVYHGVTPVTPVDPTRPAHRDVLVVTLRHE